VRGRTGKLGARSLALAALDGTQDRNLSVLRMELWQFYSRGAPHRTGHPVNRVFTGRKLLNLVGYGSHVHRNCHGLCSRDSALG
jgi:hypothetical protein